jgi:succinate-acetate transporter protein
MSPSRHLVSGRPGSGGCRQRTEQRVVGGWLQIVTGLNLLYLSAATIIGEMYGRPILPVV